MLTSFNTAMLGRSVVAVPPLSRTGGMRIDAAATANLIAHLHAGGVSNYLYGGNANVYHMGHRDFAEMAETIAAACPADGLMIPSVGPDYGKMLDQAAVLEPMGFPLVMILPAPRPSTAAGAARAIRDCAARLGRGVLLYLRSEQIGAAAIGSLFDEGAIVAVKYAVPREDVLDDPYLRAILSHIPASAVISGFGEMPAIDHMRHFGLAGYTAGSVCLAPRLSSAMLAACHAGDWDGAAAIQAKFVDIEGWRDRIDPISVLHYALEWAGLVATGEILPALSAPEERWHVVITAAAHALLAADAADARNAV